MHSIVLPVTLVDSILEPYVFALNKLRITFSVDLVVEELSFVVTFVYEFQDSFSCFGTVLVLAFINLTIQPLLYPKTILLIILPLPNILGPILMRISPLSTSLIIDPLTFINISIRMVQFPLPIGLVVFPLSLVLGAIGPYLNAETLPSAVHPFAFVGDPIVELDVLQFDELLFVKGRLD